MFVKGSLWLTRCTSQTFMEGRMAGEIWKSNKSRFRGCRSSFVDKFDSVAPSRYKSGVLFFKDGGVGVVDMSLIDGP